MFHFVVSYAFKNITKASAITEQQLVKHNTKFGNVVSHFHLFHFSKNDAAQWQKNVAWDGHKEEANNNKIQISKDLLASKILWRAILVLCFFVDFCWFLDKRDFLHFEIFYNRCWSHLKRRAQKSFPLLSPQFIAFLSLFHFVLMTSCSHIAFLIPAYNDIVVKWSKKAEVVEMEEEEKHAHEKLWKLRMRQKFGWLWPERIFGVSKVSCVKNERN